MFVTSVAMLGLAVNATASVPRTHWTTYLRAGPGLQFAVLDELQPDTPLPGAVCAEGWCRVAVTEDRFGYVSRKDLALPASPALRAAHIEGGCITAALSGYHGEADPVRVCGR